MSQPAISANPAARRKRWIRWAALSAVVLVPLAFAGLFVGAVSASDTALERIPAAIVNEDALITTTAADGTETNVFAGRQLVTELTASDAEGFDWRITNAEDADAALASGEVYAILTVPKGFSTAILSASGDNPEKANITIRTDDAHSYLTGSVAQVVGQSMVTTFGNEITSRFISGIYEGIGTLGASLATAADGANQLATGASDLGTGISSLAGGAATAQSGAIKLSDGVASYTGGVTSLSAGLTKLSAGAGVLSQSSSEVTAYAGSVLTIAQRLGALNAAIQSNGAIDATTKSTAAALAADAGSVAYTGQVLAPTVTARNNAMVSGIAQSATGAAQLAAQAGSLTSGARSLSSGLGSLTAGASSAATGAQSLATGAGTLASGLETGSKAVPVYDGAKSEATADVASDPVTLTVTTDNRVSDLGQAFSTFFVPFGLWIGALAVFLVLRPTSRRALASTANNGRLVFSALARASAVTGMQALLLVALLHLALGVSWALLPATLVFALVAALAFTAFHHFLTIAFGRTGLVVSIFLLAVQMTSTGGIYPLQMLAEPFQAISPFLPLTYGVSGMQGIISGGAAGSVVGAGIALLAFGIVSVLLSLVAIRRSRRAVSLGLVPQVA